MSARSARGRGRAGARPAALTAVLSAGLLAVLLAPGAARAEGAPDGPAEAPRTGWDFAGLPLLNFTTDRGLGYGAYLATFYHGSGGAMPYRASVGGQFYRTTKGYQFHKVTADFPNIGGSGVRVDVTAGYETWADAWYFGVGNFLPRLPPADTPERFYAYDSKSLWVVPNLRVPLGGPWGLFTGAVLRYAEIGVFPGSRLDRDRPVGTGGGLLDVLSLGLILDTRDREPSPTSGVFSEISVRASHRVIGSDFGYVGANFTHRQWWPLIDRVLVLALRAGADLQSGGAPFFHQHVLGGSQWLELGGNLSLRGLPNGRYRGHVTLFGDLEARTTVFSGPVFGRKFEVILTPFADVARVFARREADRGLGVHLTFGAGPRLIYRDVFVVRLDVACGLEDYAAPEDPSGARVARRGPVLGVYAIVNHAF